MTDASEAINSRVQKLTISDFVYRSYRVPVNVEHVAVWALRDWHRPNLLACEPDLCTECRCRGWTN